MNRREFVNVIFLLWIFEILSKKETKHFFREKESEKENSEKIGGITAWMHGESPMGCVCAPFSLDRLSFS